MSTSRPLIFAGLMAASFVLALSGCSGFERDWQALAEGPVPADSVEGRWEGSWTSEATGHTGGLRAIIERTDASQESYRVRYHATWGCCFWFNYTLSMMNVQRREGAIEFAAEEDLGWPFGNYKYSGEVKGAKFRSSYEAESDHGVFEMARPSTEAPKS